MFTANVKCNSNALPSVRPLGTDFSTQYWEGSTWFPLLVVMAVSGKFCKGKGGLGEEHPDSRLALARSFHLIFTGIFNFYGVWFVYLRHGNKICNDEEKTMNINNWEGLRVLDVLRVSRSQLWINSTRTHCAWLIFSLLRNGTIVPQAHRTESKLLWSFPD